MTDIKITADVRERLMMLENEHGQLTPSVVVADAKADDSPLHGLFDWNVESAAMRYWIHRARTIISSVKVTVVTQHMTVKVPVYVREPGLTNKQQGYVSVAQLKADPVQARESLLLEFGRAESALTRARTVAIALNMEDDIDALVLRMAGLREQIVGSPATQEQRVA